MPVQRTTVRLDAHLLAEAKRYAVETRRTLTAVLEDALRVALARRQSGKRPRRRVRVTTAGAGGLLRGVELDSNAALLDRMGGRNTAR